MSNGGRRGVHALEESESPPRGGLGHRVPAATSACGESPGQAHDAPRPCGRAWATFLRNNADAIWADEFLPARDFISRPLFARFNIERPHGGSSTSARRSTRPLRGSPSDHMRRRRSGSPQVPAPRQWRQVRAALRLPRRREPEPHRRADGLLARAVGGGQPRVPLPRVGPKREVPRGATRRGDTSAGVCRALPG